MKKILKINALIVILFSTLLMFFTFKNNDSSQWMNWGQSSNSQNIYLRNTGYSGTDMFALLSNLAEETKVNVIKTDYLVFDDKETIVKSVFITNENDALFNTNSLQEGNVLTINDNLSEKYLSTYSTEDELCIGEIFDFLNDDKVEIWTLNKFKNERGSLDGDYIIRSDNPDALNFFVDELAERSGIEKEELIKQKTFISIEESPIETMSRIGVIVSLIVFAVLNIFYAIDNSKKIGVLKLNGYSNNMIWIELILSIIGTVIMITVLLDILMLFVIENNTVSFMVSILKIELIIILLLLFVSLLVHYIVRRNKISNLVKNKKNVKHIVTLTYIVKSIVLFILVILAVSIGTGLKQASDEYKKMENWNSVSDLAVLVNLETGEDAASIKQGDNKLDNDFVKYYSYLDQKGSIYTNIIEFIPHVQFRTNYNENTGEYGYVDYFNPNLVPQSYSLTTFQINDNYLKAYPIYDINGNPIRIENTENRVILIPQSREKEVKEIEELYKSSYIDSIKSVERKQGIINDDIPEVKVESVIYKENEEGYFTFSTKFEDSKYLTYSPVFEVLTDNNMAAFEKSNICIQGINSPLKIDLKDTTSKQYNKEIAEVLDDYDLLDNNLKYMTIGEVFATQINALKNVCRQYTIALIIVCLIMGLITIHLTKLLIQANKQKYCIKKLYGYTFMDRYKGMLFIGTSINLIVVIAALILGLQITNTEITVLSIGIVAGLLFIDLFFITILIKYFENKSVAQVVKGE